MKVLLVELDAFRVGVTLMARIIVGGTFLWAGIAKVQNSDAFTQSVRGPQSLFPSNSLPLAQVLPALEVVLGSLLLLGLFVRWVGLASLLLLFAFTAVLLLSFVRGRQTTCFCFGSDGGVVGWWTIHRNIGLILLAGVVAVSHAPVVSMDVLFDHDHTVTPPIDHVAAATAFSLGAVSMWLLIGEALRYRSYR